MKKIFHGWVMSESPDNFDIALFSMFIKDGFNSYDALIRKYCSVRGKNHQEARDRLYKLKKAGKLGYYYHKKETCGSYSYYFIQWEPGDIVYGGVNSKSSKQFASWFRCRKDLV